MLEDLSIGFVQLKKDEVLEAVRARVEQGDPALEILEDARRAMTTVGGEATRGSFVVRARKREPEPTLSAGTRTP